jgi:Ser/Thr protein kinase RdoA (MazF antagonist)
MNLDIRPIIEQYDASCHPTASEYLAGVGGFSGSQFWRLTTPRGKLALRCYAPGLTNSAQLVANATWLRLIDRESLGFRVPVPIANNACRPYVEHRLEYWDLCDWLPGETVPEGQVTLAHVSTAMTALAKLHRAIDKRVPRATSPVGMSVAVMKRQMQILELRGGIQRTIVDRVLAAPDATPFWREAANTLGMWFNIESGRLAKALEPSAWQVPVSVCLGDVWRDNLLYDPQAQVLSMIDFAKFEPDSSALDIARLLGSLIAGYPQWWAEGLAAYESVRPISNAERDLAILLDQANVILSAWNWLEWLFVERRKFSDLHRVKERVRHFLTRLPEVFAPNTPRW